MRYRHIRYDLKHWYLILLVSSIDELEESEFVTKRESFFSDEDEVWISSLIVFGLMPSSFCEFLRVLEFFLLVETLNIFGILHNLFVLFVISVFSQIKIRTLITTMARFSQNSPQKDVAKSVWELLDST